MRTSAVIVALAVASTVAQTKYGSSLDMTVNPQSVEAAQRAGWCTAQSNSCYMLCNDDATTNDCDFNTLSYDCKCTANNSAPGLQYYTQTMPTFLCQTLFAQCIEQNVNSASGQKACKTDIGDLCATNNPPEPEDADNGDGGDDDGDSDSASTTGDDKPSATGGDSASNTESKSLAGATGAPQAMGALVAVGLVAAFL